MTARKFALIENVNRVLLECTYGTDRQFEAEICFSACLAVGARRC